MLLCDTAVVLNQKEPGAFLIGVWKYECIILKCKCTNKISLG